MVFRTAICIILALTCAMMMQYIGYVTSFADFNVASLVTPMAGTLPFVILLIHLGFFARGDRALLTQRYFFAGMASLVLFMVSAAAESAFGAIGLAATVVGNSLLLREVWRSVRPQDDRQSEVSVPRWKARAALAGWVMWFGLLSWRYYDAFFNGAFEYAFIMNTKEFGFGFGTPTSHAEMLVFQLLGSLVVGIFFLATIGPAAPRSDPDLSLFQEGGVTA